MIVGQCDRGISYAYLLPLLYRFAPTYWGPLEPSSIRYQIVSYLCQLCQIVAYLCQLCQIVSYLCQLCQIVSYLCQLCQIVAYLC